MSSCSAAPARGRPFWKHRWVRISAVLTAIAAFVGFVADLSSVVSAVDDYFADDPPSPMVEISPVDVSGHQCTRFVFSRLPEDFTLRRIQFRIVDSEGPAPFSGHMASEILRLPVNQELPPAVLTGETTEFSVILPKPFQANQRNDAAVVNYCAMLNRPGFRGQIHVVPTFFSISNDEIEDIEIVTHDGTPNRRRFHHRLVASDERRSVSCRTRNAAGDSMKILVFLCSILLFATDAIAQGLDRASMAILERGVHVDVSAELAPIIANTPSQPSASVLWSDALAVSASPLANEPSGRASITRLMEAALILAGAAPDQLHLDRLASEDILAMQSASRFPDVGDLLIYLLERGPSVRDTFSHESYTAIRAAPDELPYRILQERTDRPYLGLGPEFQAKILDPEHDPVFREPSERAKTRRLNLAALPDIVLAAKAFRATGRARPQERLYPLMIAVHAVDRAFRANSDGFRPVIYSVQTSALRELRAYRGNNPILLSEVQRAEFRVPSTYFFARFFQSAAEAYASAQVPRDDPRGHLWAAWGEALSRFACRHAWRPLNCSLLLREFSHPGRLDEQCQKQTGVSS